MKSLLVQNDNLVKLPEMYLLNNTPGALVPALLSDGISGREFQAQDYAGMGIEQALQKAEHQQ